MPPDWNLWFSVPLPDSSGTSGPPKARTSMWVSPNLPPTAFYRTDLRTDPHQAQYRLETLSPKFKSELMDFWTMTAYLEKHQEETTRYTVRVYPCAADVARDAKKAKLRQMLAKEEKESSAGVAEGPKEDVREDEKSAGPDTETVERKVRMAKKTTSSEGRKGKAKEMITPSKIVVKLPAGTTTTVPIPAPLTPVALRMKGRTELGASVTKLPTHIIWSESDDDSDGDDFSWPSEQGSSDAESIKIKSTSEEISRSADDAVAGGAGPSTSTMPSNLPEATPRSTPRKPLFDHSQLRDLERIVTEAAKSVPAGEEEDDLHQRLLSMLESLKPAPVTSSAGPRADGRICGKPPQPVVPAVEIVKPAPDAPNVGPDAEGRPRRHVIPPVRIRDVPNIKYAAAVEAEKQAKSASASPAPQNRRDDQTEVQAHFRRHEESASAESAPQVQPPSAVPAPAPRTAVEALKETRPLGCSWNVASSELALSGPRWPKYLPSGQRAPLPEPCFESQYALVSPHGHLRSIARPTDVDAGMSLVSIDWPRQGRYYNSDHLFYRAQDITEQGLRAYLRSVFGAEWSDAEKTNIMMYVKCEGICMCNAVVPFADFEATEGKSSGINIHLRLDKKISPDPVPARAESAREQPKPHPEVELEEPAVKPKAEASTSAYGLSLVDDLPSTCPSPIIDTPPVIPSTSTKDLADAVLSPTSQKTLKRLYLSGLLNSPLNSAASTRVLRILEEEDVNLDSSLGLKMLDLARSLRTDGELGKDQEAKMVAPEKADNTEGMLRKVLEKLNDHSGMLNAIAEASGVNLLDDDEPEAPIVITPTVAKREAKASEVKQEPAGPVAAEAAPAPISATADIMATLQGVADSVASLTSAAPSAPPEAEPERNNGAPVPAAVPAANRLAEIAASLGQAPTLFSPNNPTNQARPLPTVEDYNSDNEDSDGSGTTTRSNAATTGAQARRRSISPQRGARTRSVSSQRPSEPRNPFADPPQFGRSVTASRPAGPMPNSADRERLARPSNEAFARYAASAQAFPSAAAAARSNVLGASGQAGNREAFYNNVDSYAVPPTSRFYMPKESAPAHPASNSHMFGCPPPPPAIPHTMKGDPFYHPHHHAHHPYGNPHHHPFHAHSQANFGMFGPVPQYGNSIFATGSARSRASAFSSAWTAPRDDRRESQDSSVDDSSFPQPRSSFTPGVFGPWS